MREFLTEVSARDMFGNQCLKAYGTNIANIEGMIVIEFRVFFFSEILELFIYA